MSTHARTAAIETLGLPHDACDTCLANVIGHRIRSIVYGSVPPAFSVATGPGSKRPRDDDDDVMEPAKKGRPNPKYPHFAQLRGLFAILPIEILQTVLVQNPLSPLELRSVSSVSPAHKKMIDAFVNDYARLHNEIVFSMPKDGQDQILPMPDEWDLRGKMIRFEAVYSPEQVLWIKDMIPRTGASAVFIEEPITDHETAVMIAETRIPTLGGVGFKGMDLDKEVQFLVHRIRNLNESFDDVTGIVIRGRVVPPVWDASLGMELMSIHFEDCKSRLSSVRGIRKHYGGIAKSVVIRGLLLNVQDYAPDIWRQVIRMTVNDRKTGIFASFESLEYLDVSHNAWLADDMGLYIGVLSLLEKVDASHCPEITSVFVKHLVEQENRITHISVVGCEGVNVEELVFEKPHNKYTTVTIDARRTVDDEAEEVDVGSQAVVLVSRVF